MVNTDYRGQISAVHNDFVLRFFSGHLSSTTLGRMLLTLRANPPPYMDVQ